MASTCVRLTCTERHLKSVCGSAQKCYHLGRKPHKPGVQLSKGRLNPLFHAQVMAGSRLMRAERWFLYALIPLTLALSVAGVYSSVAELVDKVRGQ